MQPLKVTLISCLFILLGACTSGGQPPSGTSASENPYAGKYIGEEILEGGTLEGGTFALRISINDEGKVRVRDIDNRVATGYMEGSKFTAKRGGSAPQVFYGEISGNKITGTTTDNPYMGPGTFSAERQ